MHIDDLLRETVSAKASDLHLTVGVPPTTTAATVKAVAAITPTSAAIFIFTPPFSREATAGERGG